jgi:hypothetical protein
MPPCTCLNKPLQYARFKGTDGGGSKATVHTYQTLPEEATRLLAKMKQKKDYSASKFNRIGL